MSGRRDFTIADNPGDPSRPLALLNERGEILEVHSSADALRDMAHGYGADTVDGKPLHEVRP